MENLSPWNVMKYKDFSRFYFDLFKNAYKVREINSKIYFRITKSTWKSRGQIASVVFPKYNGSSLKEVFCMIKRQNPRISESVWITFYESDIELAMLKVDILATESGYTISDAFNVTVLQERYKCAAS